MGSGVAAKRITGPERRRRILDAAAEAFAARGYHATSVGQVAEAAGITKPVVYDHFRSKRELFVELLENTRDELLARGTEALGGDAPPVDRIRAAIDAFFAYVEERPAAARVLLTPPSGEPELLEVSQRVQFVATARMAALLRSDPGLLPGARDRKRRIELFVAFIQYGAHGLATWWADHPRVPRSALVDATMDLVWVGLRNQFSSPAF